MIPQIILITFGLIQIGFIMGMHGEKKEFDEYHFGRTLFFTVFSAIFLYWGGFWNVLLK